MLFVMAGVGARVSTTSTSLPASNGCIPGASFTPHRVT
jgi:hypothetical protein